MPANGSTPKPIFASRSQVTAALQRAAGRARVIAEQTDTRLVVSTPQSMPAGEVDQTAFAQSIKDQIQPERRSGLNLKTENTAAPSAG
ncbi:MAG: hypothetical protein JZU64_16895 [Rhodoferax sp.]|nr:hypothetical protein [Rhodoferax sp.]